MKWIRSTVRDAYFREVALFRREPNPCWLAMYGSAMAGSVPRLFLYMCMLSLLACWLTNFNRTNVAGAFSLLSFGLFFAAHVVSIVYGLRAASETNANRAKDLCLCGFVCPACGYSLKNLPADEHGVTICPECQSAWRLPSTM